MIYIKSLTWHFMIQLQMRSRVVASNNLRSVLDDVTTETGVGEFQEN